jgi:hypothetical protein
MENHLAEKHPTAYQTNASYSEIHLQLASLLGIALTGQKTKQWKCPCGYCETEFERYFMIADHVCLKHPLSKRFFMMKLEAFEREYYAIWTR